MEKNLKLTLVEMTELVVELSNILKELGVNDDFYDSLLLKNFIKSFDSLASSLNEAYDLGINDLSDDELDKEDWKED